MSHTIAIFVSGNGTNCENIIRYFSANEDIHVGLVVSNRSGAYALTRAQRHHVPTAVISRVEWEDEAAVLELLDRHDIDFIVLAGFLLLVPHYLIRKYPHRIINLHPALLPMFGGKGMYGHHVHEAVYEAVQTGTVTDTGITIHYVNDKYDEGEVIAQFRTPLTTEDSVEDIEARIHELEQQYFPEVISQVLENL